MGKPKKADIVMHSYKTPETIGKVLALLRNAVPVEGACAIAGVHRGTWYAWLKADAGLKQAHDDAIQASEATLVLELRKETAWQAKAWLLERRFPERWRRRDQIEQVHVGGPQVIKLTWGDEKADTQGEDGENNVKEENRIH
jgi:hypothetical protein